MSKYNLSDLVKEYIGGGRIGTLKISYRDLVDKMDQLEQSGEAVVRELSGPSGDGKVNREFEVVTNRSAVPGGNKQERGFTVYDYKFGFDPGSMDHFEEEYDFSVGGNDLDFAMELIPDIVPYRLEEEKSDNVIKDLAQADEVIKMIKMMNPDVRQDLLMRIARMGQKMDENRREKNPEGIGQLYVQPAVQKAVKFHLDAYDKGDIDVDDMIQAVEDIIFGYVKAPGMREQMYIDDDEFEMEMGRSKKDSLKKEMMIHVDQLIDGNIDMNDFMNVVEEIMAEVKSMKEEDAIEDEPVTEDMFGPVKFLKSKGISDEMISDFMKMHSKDIIGASEDEIMDEFENFRSVNYDYIDEDLKAHFKRFK